MGEHKVRPYGCLCRGRKSRNGRTQGSPLRMLVPWAQISKRANTRFAPTDACAMGANLETAEHKVRPYGRLCRGRKSRNGRTQGSPLRMLVAWAQISKRPNTRFAPTDACAMGANLETGEHKVRPYGCLCRGRKSRNGRTQGSPLRMLVPWAQISKRANTRFAPTDACAVGANLETGEHKVRPYGCLCRGRKFRNGRTQGSPLRIP